MGLNKNFSGLVWGAFLGSFHLIWGILVALGWAQWILDFIFKIHMMSNPINVLPFSLGSTVTLVVVTAVLGYIFGWFFALIWNVLHKRR